MRNRKEIRIKLKVYNQMLEDFEDPKTVSEDIYRQICDRVFTLHWVLGSKTLMA